jgi:hypothetical protein
MVLTEDGISTGCLKNIQKEISGGKVKTLWNTLFCGRASEILRKKSSLLFKEFFIEGFVCRKFVSCMLVYVLN